MIDARSMIRSTDWAALHHAYGDAADAPNMLLDLLSEDPQRCGAALGYLDAAVLHQGSLYSVTAPAALFVAGILDDPRSMTRCESALPWDDRERPLRAALLDWLGSVAESVFYWDEDEDIDDIEDEDDEDEDEDEDDEEDEDEQAAAACRAIRRDLYFAVLPFLDDADDAVRKAAVGAMGYLMRAPELVEFRGEQAQRMQRLAHDATVSERAAAALTLGSWGLVPQAFLADPDPSVRAAAALASALDPDPQALAEVRRALVDPAAADDWFAEHLPQLAGKFRFSLVEALLRRTRSFEETLPEALAIARMTNAYTVESDWGPLLERAFPARHAQGQALTAAQQEFLSAIVDNEECWGNVANPMSWFGKTGLPYDRESLRALVSGT
ncbi:hypothetical protein [Saccharopolyspora shandongensis]|uniref:hypothetical protein n=1 Tax=Saccharopolyspora shandongensis TaxID=418495 RepID=UPI0033FD80CF